VNPDVHSRFRILLSIISAIFPMTTIFPVTAIFASLAIFSAASMTRKNATGREQGDNA
jgi:hypothetical protein